MDLPEEQELWERLCRLATYDIIHGVCPPGGSILVRFPLDRYEGDIRELARDLVQKTRIELSARAQPAEPVRNWLAFLRQQVQGRILDEIKREKRHPSPEPLVQPTQDRYGAVEWRELDVLDHRLTPEQLLIQEELRQELSRKLRELQSVILVAISTEFSLWASDGRIRPTDATVDAFLKVATAFIQEPWIPFLKHLKMRSTSDPHTPNRATANRWWRQLLRDIPKLESYAKIAKGD